ncbi:response regulator transcription factor [Mycolicibacterium sphagni]|uniref:DNA-binding response regulator n=1 Tax=Mycolicibacterium sphagni TaxID=1786 RepID=A0A255DEP1_9MYCO|nr:response regulator transcription factor [Mycolicibacterium sphagni]OYN77927.1 DNA-binding response regulator [Mycolicibacterium sphagni]
MAQLLLVEDDKTIGKLLADGLQTNGHHVTWSRTGLTALREAERRNFDLGLLDLGLPDLDGVEVCRQLRATQPGCVLVILTARDAEIDAVVGLDAGADDYLTKPFRYAELLARIRAHLRRGPVPAAPAESHVIGELVVEPAARMCTFAGHPISLRAREFDLLARLAADADFALTRETLIADVWDQNWYGSTKTLDVHIAILRRKLATAIADHRTDPAGAPRITTLRGYGYRLDSPRSMPVNSPAKFVSGEQSHECGTAS